MSHADDETTKTAVIKNDVHSAISLFADIEETTIQGFINRTLADTDEVQKYQQVIAERDDLLAKDDDLSQREAETIAIDRVL